MAHDIQMKVPPRTLGNSDVEFEVRSGGELLGRLKVSKGGLDWYRKNAKTVTSTARWSQLRNWMEDVD